MLQFFRSFAKSFVAKLLFAVLLLSFGIWGVGDLFRQNGGGTSVITVGDKEIGADQLRIQIDQNLQRLKMNGMSIDRQQAKQYGIVDNAVENLVDRALLDAEAARLGLTAGDVEIAQAINDDPTFHDKDGKLDRERFKSLLLANHMTEQQYVGLLRDEIPRTAIASLAQVGRAPTTLARLIFDQKQERRVADFVFLPAAAISGIPQPSEAQLKAFYEQHKRLFTTAEYRDFTALLITSADALAAVTVTDAQLTEAYQFRLNEFKHGELRDVQQMLLPDQATAQRAEAALNRGGNFAQIAQSLAHQNADTVDLGLVERQNLPAELADPAFAAKLGEATQPLKTQLGWTILKITAIKPAATRPFDEVKGQLQEELKREQSGDALYQLSNKIEDALAAGADVSAIAQQFNLKPIKVLNVDSAGRLANGQAQTSLAVDAAPILKAAFDTAQGQTSPLQQTNDDKFYLVHVDRVQRQTLLPFVQARDSVLAAWMNDQRNAKVAEEAKTLAKSVTQNTPLATVAAAHGLAISTSQPLLRTDTESALPPELLQQLFAAKVGEAATAPGRNGTAAGTYVATLKEIRLADTKIDTAELDAINKRLQNDLTNEIGTELTSSLRERYPVKINQKALDQIL